MPSPQPQPALGREFARLYREQFEFVWRMLLHFGVPPAGAEDAAQDVFMVVHRRWDDLDAHVSARSWLYGIARRVAADHRRKRSRHERKLEALPRVGPGRDLELEVGDRELIEALERALAELDPARREVFVLAEIEGMTAREISEAIGANPNTIAARLRAARVHVSATLARWIEPPRARSSHGRAR
ncbi:MAG TPA: sigma-70 family RNA polymerase sigma factor [Enhygromyxa sp.]|nr:sigma-70 family RNA polymerase sigma factor [Enhygromyxa sp.]